jgi:hypothetical protein
MISGDLRTVGIELCESQVPFVGSTVSTRRRQSPAGPVHAHPEIAGNAPDPGPLGTGRDDRRHLVGVAILQPPAAELIPSALAGLTPAMTCSQMMPRSNSANMNMARPEGVGRGGSIASVLAFSSR